MTDPRTTQESPSSDPAGRLAPSTWRWLDIAFAFGLTLVALGVLVLSESLVVSALGVRTGHPGQLLGVGLFTTLLFELCLLVLALWFSVGKYRQPLSRFGFTSFPSWGWALPIAGILGSYVILIAYNAIVSALHLHALVPKSNVPDNLYNYRNLIPFGGIEICLVAPIAEESFFRGFLFHGLLGKRLGARGAPLSHRLGFVGAALPSGLLFALFHVQPSLLIPFTGVGVLFAWIFWQSGSLWPNIMTHAGFNLISFGASLATHH
jgi:membrane protease YdiL (CAAX protease family)